MSNTITDAQDAFFDDYKKWCADNNVPATLDGFDIWLVESDKDPEEDWMVGENDQD